MADLVQLEARVEALADFVTTVVAALIVDDALPAAVLEAIAQDTPCSTAPGANPATATDRDVAALARAALAVAGLTPLPRPVRLVHSTEDVRGDNDV